MVIIMIVCCVKEKIIIFRNVYKFVINGFILLGVMFIFMKFYIDSDLGIVNGIDIEELKEMIVEYLDVKVVFVINLIYFGVIFNLEEVVKIVYVYDMLVLCDEVYGVYFNFNDKLLISVMVVGVDMLVGSIYKIVGLLI